MKSFSLTLLFICSMSISAFAQDDALSSTAEALFRSANSTLTNAEKNQIATLSGFELTDNEELWYRTTYEKEANIPFNVRLYTLDLTNDGVEEIGIIYGPQTGSGKKGLASLLFVKNPEGQFQLSIDTPGEFFFINLNNMVFPDVLVKSESFELPIYRWDGAQYNEHKLLARKKLKRLNTTSMSQASNRYVANLMRE